MLTEKEIRVIAEALKSVGFRLYGVEAVVFYHPETSADGKITLSIHRESTNDNLTR